MDYGREQITFEITEHIGVLGVYHTGWKKELNLVSWNGNEPKYDIRDWDPAHERMSRGITLSEKEMGKIRDLLEKRERGTQVMQPEIKKNKGLER